MKRLTKKYSNGKITLNGEALNVNQETIDRELNAFEPFATVVEKLYEYEEAGLDPATIDRLKSRYFGTSV